MSKFSTDLLKDLITSACSITEYRVVNPRVAQVLVNVSAAADSESIAASITKQLKETAAPIQGSFRWLQRGASMIGYVATFNGTRVLDGKQSLEAGYRCIASNLYLDNQDKTLWELKSGASGQYLSRQGRDDLSELIEAARVSPRGSMPRMHAIVNASAAPKTLVAFVNSIGLGNPSIDYGFCLGQTTDGRTVIAARDYSAPVAVTASEIVGVYNVDGREVHKLVTAALKETAAGKVPTADSIEYYKKLYSYAPDYLKKVIKEVEEQAAL
jgi:hypothetical protein